MTVIEDLLNEESALEKELKALRLKEAEILKEKQLKEKILQLKRDILKAKRSLEA